MPQLVNLRIRQLLGRFDHEIRFPSNWPLLIIHGPNGVGKTKVLEIITAVSSADLNRLLAVPFETVQLDYADSSSVMVARRVLVPELTDFEEDARRSLQLDVTLVRPDETPLNFSITSPAMTNREARILANESGYVQVGPNEWIDPSDGEHVTTNTLRMRFGFEVRHGLEDDLDPSSRAVRNEFREFMLGVPVHLIETQRLLATKPLNTRRPGRTPNVPSATVARYAEDLVSRLNRALADNTTTAQTLDRTFPRRVLNAADPNVTDEQIRERYVQQGLLRDQLESISLLDAATGELPLPDRALNEWERLFLWTYLDDTDKKLATFQPLLDRAQLLRDIVNSHFLFKRLSIDRERGFRFATTEGVELDPEMLSSGEQHELVLSYDLLFNVTPGSLVLIDEPEISLHVAWQQQFLSDLTRISELQSLRFIVATHSPQVIHKWWEYAMPLYEEASAESGPREASE